MTDRERLSSFTRKRFIFFLLFVILYVITEIGRYIYRPYIYTNNIFDFWIADTVGNFTGTMTIIFCEFAVINPDKKTGNRLLFMVTFGLIGYELVQYFITTHTCDWKDMVATLFAGLLSWGTVSWLSKRYKDEQLE